MSTVRHFTATGFVVHHGCVALHWHREVQAWLPPGGHIAENEDPVQAVVREIEEETGIAARVVQAEPPFELDYPEQVQPPLTIMVEDIHDPVDGYHQHVDMIYVCRPAGPLVPLNDGWRWVSRDELASGASLEREDGHAEPPPEDVRVLGLHALKIAANPKS